MTISLFLILLSASTYMYYFLHKKTRMNIRFIFIDNLLVVAVAFVISFLLYHYLLLSLGNMFRFLIALSVGGMLILGLAYSITMIRFWRTPKRKITAGKNEIISPADGNIIYIRKIEAGETPISVKNGQLNSLDELTKTSLLATPCWLIGINMTPWDVHKNCAPIDGKVTLNLHTKGAFLSLKKFDALTQNERNTYVIDNGSLKLGVVQIASKGVRRIDSYVNTSDLVKRGDWLGMIRFGSQVDVILPYDCKIKVKFGQQIYAAKTIIGSL
ncbi:Phosphatidylserine decarboxylase proenzyme [anaerobic digester metagenome]